VGPVVIAVAVLTSGSVYAVPMLRQNSNNANSGSRMQSITKLGVIENSNNNNSNNGNSYNDATKRATIVNLSTPTSFNSSGQTSSRRYRKYGDALKTTFTVFAGMNNVGIKISFTYGFNGHGIKLVRRTDPSQVGDLFVCGSSSDAIVSATAFYQISNCETNAEKKRSVTQLSSSNNNNSNSSMTDSPPKLHGNETQLLAILTSTNSADNRSITVVDARFLTVPLLKVCLDVGIRYENIFSALNNGVHGNGGGSNNLFIVAANTDGLGEGRLVPLQQNLRCLRSESDRIFSLCMLAFGRDGFDQKGVATILDVGVSTAGEGSDDNDDSKDDYIVTSKHSVELRGYLGRVVLKLEQCVDGLGGGNEDDSDSDYENVNSSNNNNNNFDSQHFDVDAALTTVGGLFAPDSVRVIYALYCLACISSSSQTGSGTRGANNDDPNEVLAAACLKGARAARSFDEYANFRLDSKISKVASRICGSVGDTLLGLGAGATDNVSSGGTVGGRGTVASRKNFTEAAVHMFAVAGLFGRSIAAMERLKSPKFSCAYLEGLWGGGKKGEEAAKLALSAARNLIQSNPLLGLDVFISQHDKDGSDHPLNHPVNPMEVVVFLKSVVPVNTSSSKFVSPLTKLPLTTGNALASTFLMSALRVGSDASSSAVGKGKETAVQPPLARELHNELCYLLLEGVVGEMGDEDNHDNSARADGVSEDSPLAAIYRKNLHDFISWPQALFDAKNMIDFFPSSFKLEQALLLGKLGEHEKACTILLGDLDSTKLALEYCDLQHSNQLKQRQRQRHRQKQEQKGRKDEQKQKQNCPYLPLLSVALQKHNYDPSLAITIMRSRMDRIDKAAALRLLPPETSLSAVNTSFLIPALKKDESERKMLLVGCNLLRGKYMELKRELLEAQLSAQGSIGDLIASKRLGLGSFVRSSRSFVVNSTTHVNFQNVVLKKVSLCCVVLCCVVLCCVVLCCVVLCCVVLCCVVLCCVWKVLFRFLAAFLANYLSLLTYSVCLSYFLHEQHLFSGFIVLEAIFSNTRFENFADIDLRCVDSSREDVLCFSESFAIKTLPVGATTSAWCLLGKRNVSINEDILLTFEVTYNIGGAFFTEVLEDVLVQPYELRMQ